MSAEPGSAPASQAYRYKVFISYSHLEDRGLAGAVQRALQRLGKPWYRARNFRIFRDSTDLGASPELWPMIERGLDESEFLIVMASPAAAGSRWVAKEIRHWLATKSSRTLLLCISSGKLAWSEVTNDFDWSLSTALPEALENAFAGEPRYEDFSELDEAAFVLENEVFREKIAGLAAPLLDLPKSEIVGLHLREHRKTIRTAGWALVFMTVLTTASIFLFFRARAEERRAEEQALEVKRQLTRVHLEEGRRSMLDERLADSIHALNEARKLDSGSADTLDYLLSRARLKFGGLVARLESFDGPVFRLHFSPDDELVAQGPNGRVRTWNDLGQPLVEVAPYATMLSSVREEIFEPGVAGEDGIFPVDTKGDFPSDGRLPPVTLRLARPDGTLLEPVGDWEEGSLDGFTALGADRRILLRGSFVDPGPQGELKSGMYVLVAEEGGGSFRQIPLRGTETVLGDGADLNRWQTGNWAIGRRGDFGLSLDIHRQLTLRAMGKAEGLPPRLQAWHLAGPSCGEVAWGIDVSREVRNDYGPTLRLVAGESECLLLYDERPCRYGLAGGELLQEIEEDDVRLAGYSRGDRFLVLASFGEVVVLALADGGKTVYRDSVEEEVSCIAPSPSSELVALGMESGQVRVIQPGSGEVVASFRFGEAAITACDLSRDETRIAVGNSLGEVAVFEMRRDDFTGVVDEIPRTEGTAEDAVVGDLVAAEERDFYVYTVEPMIPELGKILSREEVAELEEKYRDEEVEDIPEDTGYEGILVRADDLSPVCRLRGSGQTLPEQYRFVPGASMILARVGDHFQKAWKIGESSVEWKTRLSDDWTDWGLEIHEDIFGDVLMTVEVRKGLDGIAYPYLAALDIESGEIRGRCQIEEKAVARNYWIWFSGDGARVQVVTGEGSHRFSFSGEEIVKIGEETFPTWLVTDVWLVRDGESEVVYLQDNDERLWLLDGNEDLTLVNSDATVLRASPRRNILAAATGDGGIELWNARGDLVREIAPSSNLEAKLAADDADAEVVVIAFDRQGTRLAGISEQGVFRLWDITTGELLDRRLVPPPEAAPYGNGTLVVDQVNGRFLYKTKIEVGQNRIQRLGMPLAPPTVEECKKMLHALGYEAEDGMLRKMTRGFRLISPEIDAPRRSP